MEPTFVDFQRFYPGRKQAMTSLPLPVTSSIVPNIIWALSLLLMPLQNIYLFLQTRIIQYVIPFNV